MTEHPADPRRLDEGFTLIELLVVVVVIAVLAAVAVPVYFAQQRSARDAGVVSDVRNTTSSAAAWVLKNSGTAVTNTADFMSAGGTLVRSGANVIDVTTSGTGAFTVCGYTADGSAYTSNSSAYLYSSDTRRAARTTAGCPGDGVSSTAAAAPTTGSTTATSAPVATASTTGTGSAGSTSTPTPTPTWVDCAQEWGTCSFSGTHVVRYGLAPSSYVTRTITNGTVCSNDVFGDPAYGYAKQCSYQP